MDEPVIKAVKGEHYTGNDFFEEMKRRLKEELEDRNEMYLQVGRTIVSLSDVEQYLASFFALFSLLIPEKESSGFFMARKVSAESYSLGFLLSS